jgi:putative ATP-dependent endonuclease of the OLD family
MRTHNVTFEVAHKHENINELVKYPENYVESHGKPFNANKYWSEILEPNFNSSLIDKVPIVIYLKEIIGFNWKLKE